MYFEADRILILIHYFSNWFYYLIILLFSNWFYFLKIWDDTEFHKGWDETYLWFCLLLTTTIPNTLNRCLVCLICRYCPSNLVVTLEMKFIFLTCGTEWHEHVNRILQLIVFPHWDSYEPTFCFSRKASWPVKNQSIECPFWVLCLFMTG